MTWKIESKEGTYVKVISFPVPPDSGVAGESMWVLRKDGTNNDGTGWLSNEPAFCNVVKHGSLVEYGGGNDHLKPYFVKVVEFNPETSPCIT